MARKYHGHVVAVVLDLRTHMVEQMRELGEWIERSEKAGFCGLQVSAA